MKPAADLALDACYLQGVLDAACELIFADQPGGSPHTVEMVTCLLAVSARLAADLKADLDRLAG